MKNQYSVSELVKTVYSLLMTKLLYRDARLIRRPVYVRGSRNCIDGAVNLTTGRFCRFDLIKKKKTLHIGKECQLGDMTHIVAHNDVRIGDYVLFASKCFVSDTNHGMYNGEFPSSPYEAPVKREQKVGTTIIGNNVWVGEYTVILAGAEIGDGCVIGANSTVTKKYPANSVIAGSPAKVIKKWNDEKQLWIKV